jgi:hypothetical protein
MSDGLSEAFKNVNIHQKTLVVNIFGGPGAGKTILCAEIFAGLKRKGIETEMSLEYAKQLIWRNQTLQNQEEIFQKQLEQLNCLGGKVEVIVTDAPLLHTTYYSDDKKLKKKALNYHHTFQNYNLFLQRDESKYQQIGRIQDLKKAKEIDFAILEILRNYNLPYDFYTLNDTTQIIQKIEISKNVE